MPSKGAWTAILDALPAHWRVGDPTFDADRRLWRAMAMSERSGRAQPPETVSGTGASALAALSDLEVRLREAPHPDGSCVDELQNLRLLVPGSGASESPPDQP